MLATAVLKSAEVVEIVCIDQKGVDAIDGPGGGVVSSVGEQRQAEQDREDSFHGIWTIFDHVVSKIDLRS